jgi:SNF2 family DNA or RNA helicase
MNDIVLIFFLLELHTVLQETVMIRRLKADVLSELPPKHRHAIFVDADPEIAQTIQKGLQQAFQLSFVSDFHSLLCLKLHVMLVF